MIYYKKEDSGQVSIVRLDGNVMTSFAENPENVDYQAFLAWVAEGNEPEVVEL